MKLDNYIYIRRRGDGMVMELENGWWNLGLPTSKHIEFVLITFVLIMLKLVFSFLSYSFIILFNSLVQLHNISIEHRFPTSGPWTSSGLQQLKYGPRMMFGIWYKILVRQNILAFKFNILWNSLIFNIYLKNHTPHHTKCQIFF